ncbi:RDD family protein [Rhodopirellula sp. P2]|uniref:RDD family protein n=1 Tax=Rhodopirellula sp. P2 TaxID=2127060 RepID=UPI0023687A96|nr:RDD family protein [Rhodopirellula sp. P2]WDQ15983.1 RDD family protein [Rhodopirellula sp. P2]
MKPQHVDHSLGEGIYFAHESYPGFIRRLIAMMIDGAILTFAGIAIWILLALLFYVLETDRSPETLHIAIWLTIIWVYMTVIKRSWLRTIGYRLSGLQIVDTRGSRPSLMKMTFRLLMWIFGPFNFILDLMWLAADSEQQTLRDCYCGTYVVRATAQPEGSAPMHLTRYFATGLAPSYPRVVRPGKVA